MLPATPGQIGLAKQATLKVRIDLGTHQNQCSCGIAWEKSSFCCDIGQNPYLWRMPIGAILIRCMVETEIRLRG